MSAQVEIPEGTPGRYHRDGHDTERLAAERVARAGSQRARMLAMLRNRGDDGATDYDAP